MQVRPQKQSSRNAENHKTTVRKPPALIKQHTSNNEAGLRLDSKNSQKLSLITKTEKLQTFPAKPQPNISVARKKSDMARQEEDKKNLASKQIIKICKSYKPHYYDAGLENSGNQSILGKLYHEPKSIPVQQENNPITSNKNIKKEIVSNKNTFDALCCEELMENVNINQKTQFISNNNELSLTDLSEMYESDNNEHMYSEENNSSCIIDSETIAYLQKRESCYSPDPNYLTEKQNEIQSKMRAILFDWMCEVCSDYTLKRETYHYSVNYVDRYLSKVTNIKKRELQLIGLACLCLASKTEEVMSPKLSVFALAANNEYKIEEIIKMEKKIFSILSYNMTPPTLNMWANWYMCQWDSYSENYKMLFYNKLLKPGESIVQFRQPNEKSYTNYREFMQLLDTAILDSQILVYKLRPLVAALLYLVIGKNYKVFGVQNIVEIFSNTSLYLYDDPMNYNDIFSDFLMKSFNMILYDLLPYIQYASNFFDLQISIELPTAAKLNRENVLEQTKPVEEPELKILTKKTKDLNLINTITPLVIDNSLLNFVKQFI